MLAKKVNGEKEDIKRAVWTLKREIKVNNDRKSRLHPIKDKFEIDQINAKILKKQKQKLRLEQKLV